MNSYDEWFRVLVATKAASGGSEEGFALFDEWSARSYKHDPDVTRQKWESARPPYRVGFEFLARLADESSKGQFNRAALDFDPIDEPEGLRPPSHDSVDNMFERYAWIEGAQRAVHIESGALLNQEQFEFRVPPLLTVTPPGPRGGLGKTSKTSAWTILRDSPRRRQSYMNLTLRFGSGQVVMENLPDLSGPCFNVWREPKRAAPIPAKVSDADVAAWLALAEHVIPNDHERRHVLDWFAYTLQHQDQKINHALVLGSQIEGIGKDTLLEPVRVGVGRAYTREIGPQDIAVNHNQWVMGAKLVVVQEMHNFERKETMNRLKPLVAAPPEALEVNIKNRPQFFVPNLMNLVFFTNEGDALALSKGERRYFVTWNDGGPLPKETYDSVWDWLRAGGAESVVRWLLDRDVTAFDAKGRAPDTEAKADMRTAAQSPLVSWVADGIAAGDGVWARDLVLSEELAERVPEYARFRGQAVDPRKVAAALKSLGARLVTDKLRLEGMEGSRRIWAIRRPDTYSALSIDEIRDAFTGQRDKARVSELKGF